jgi:regulator of cell morphogenesis and NO signaling
MTSIEQSPAQFFIPNNQLDTKVVEEILFQLMMGREVSIQSLMPLNTFSEMIRSALNSYISVQISSGLEVYRIQWQVGTSKPFALDTVGNIVARDIRLARALIEHKIDFCCGGKELLQEVCTLNMLDISKVVKDLVGQMLSDSNDSFTPLSQDPIALTQYIQSTHHAYIRKNLPLIMSFMYKVSAVHGRQHPELIRMRTLMVSLQDELVTHLDKEEQILFPMIRSLFGSPAPEDSLCNLAVKSVEFPIATMISEHESAGEIMHVIEQLSDSYSCPTDACESYRFLYDSLDSFFRDLQVHIHLENNVLFPAATEREHLLR